MSTIDLQTLTADVKVFPFVGLTAIQRQQSGIARAQVSLVWEQTTLDGTSSGQLRAVRFSGSLPRNFAYVYAGGSIKLGRTAAAAVENQSRGVFFENEIQCAITGTDFSDSWKMLNSGVQKVELDLNKDSSASYVTLATSSTTLGVHHATPGVLNGAQGLYQKIYKDDVIPRIIYRAENADIPVTADVMNSTEDPMSSGQYVGLGEMHFLQYDMDQAYNYLIHSPVPVR